jgi:hypothetical protein
MSFLPHGQLKSNDTRFVPAKLFSQWLTEGISDIVSEMPSALSRPREIGANCLLSSLALNSLFDFNSAA